MSSVTARVYPRACGEARSLMALLCCTTGVSPRVRGSRRKAKHALARGGCIPARAGKPVLSNSEITVLRVYPRACGEAEHLRRAILTETGVSPRVRGSHDLVDRAIDDHGCIPARAGKPGCGVFRLPETRVYPRACGEACIKQVPVSIRLSMSAQAKSPAFTFV